MQKVNLIGLDFEFENRDLQILIALLAFSACQDSDAKN